MSGVLPTSPVRLSLVIPAYNESKLLPRLLDTVDAARRAYARGPDAVEVIVADNGSSDDTAAIAARYGCRVVPVAIRNIGAVRNAGARASRGELLCFVDADSRLHPDVFNAVDDALSSGKYSVGATGVTLERWSLGILCTFMLLVPIVVLTRIDTGLVFCRRADFDAVNGYDERRAAAEDVMFHVALMRHGRSKGQRAVRLTRVKAIASTRKFDEHGDWHYFQLFPHAARMLRDPAHRSAATDRYWYPDAR